MGHIDIPYDIEIQIARRLLGSCCYAEARLSALVMLWLPTPSKPPCSKVQIMRVLVGRPGYSYSADALRSTVPPKPPVKR